MYKILLLAGENNDATSYYVSIIKSAILASGDNVEIVNCTKEIGRKDRVVTVTVKSTFLVLLKNPFQYIISWFQGVIPEEDLYRFEKSRSKYIRFICWRILEYTALKVSKKVIFVSEAMMLHYKKKYGYNKNNNFIMPCFNLKIATNIPPKKYESPSFVYAGSLSRWQCIDRTLSLFNKIKQVVSSATLTILTNEREKALSLLKKYDLADQTIGYVPPEDLNAELLKYKYGFIIRDNIVVNNVATPTKMNSYISAGIIPIYSDVIHDFAKNLQNLKYAVLINNNEEDNCIEKIKQLEQSSINYNELINEYKNIFDTYYSTDKYISKMSTFLNNAKQ